MPMYDPFLKSPLLYWWQKHSFFLLLRYLFHSFCPFPFAIVIYIFHLDIIIKIVNHAKRLAIKVGSHNHCEL